MAAITAMSYHPKHGSCPETALLSEIRSEEGAVRACIPWGHEAMTGEFREVLATMEMKHARRTRIITSADGSAMPWNDCSQQPIFRMNFKVLQVAKPG
jgi:hypothetical protein